MDTITNLTFDIINDFKIIQKFTFDKIFMQYICQIRDAICIYLFVVFFTSRLSSIFFNATYIFIALLFEKIFCLFDSY